MEKFDKILNKKEKIVIKEADFVKQYPDFFKNIGKEELHKDNMLTYENEKLSISLKYEEISPEQYPAEKFPGFYYMSMIGEVDFDDYFRLTEFKIKNENFEYDLKSESKNPIVLFLKESNPKKTDGAAYSEENLITLNSLPSSPGSILTLLHELGHINDDKINEDISRKLHLRFETIMKGGSDEKIEKEQNAITIRQERVAWAYALKKLKPFIEGFQIPEESLDKYIHEFTLGSYCKEMTEEY